jgi:pyruvate/2-oxoglutarate dehydrogenase complex dihydrolipoamide acyltransferase (E2) component
MPKTRDNDRFQIEDMNGTDRALNDILGSVRRPDGYCMTMVDFTAAEAFRRARIEQTGLPITHIDLSLRALALTAGKNEKMRTLVQGYRRYRSESVDIGCLVAASTTVAPIVVFKGIDKLSLEEIYTQRIAMMQEARDDEEKRKQELARMTRFLPDSIRRRLIARFVSDPFQRHKLSGSIQLSAIELDDMEWMCPAHIGGALVVSMGGIKERPMVVDGQVVPRLSALVTFMIDQRIIHPMRAMRVFRRFRRLLENPEKLA